MVKSMLFPQQPDLFGKLLDRVQILLVFDTRTASFVKKRHDLRFSLHYNGISKEKTTVTSLLSFLFSFLHGMPLFNFRFDDNLLHMIDQHCLEKNKSQESENKEENQK